MFGNIHPSLVSALGAWTFSREAKRDFESASSIMQEEKPECPTKKNRLRWGQAGIQGAASFYAAAAGVTVLGMVSRDISVQKTIAIGASILAPVTLTTLLRRNHKWAVEKGARILSFGLLARVCVELQAYLSAPDQTPVFNAMQLAFVGFLGISSVLKVVKLMKLDDPQYFLVPQEKVTRLKEKAVSCLVGAFVAGAASVLSAVQLGMSSEQNRTYLNHTMDAVTGIALMSMLASQIPPVVSAATHANQYHLLGAYGVYELLAEPLERAVPHMITIAALLAISKIPSLTRKEVPISERRPKGDWGLLYDIVPTSFTGRHVAPIAMGALVEVDRWITSKISIAISSSSS